MVLILIQLRATATRHRMQRASRLPLVLALIFGLTFAIGTMLLGFGHHARTGADGDILAAVFALWLAGQLTQSALAGGDSTLRPEMFALLPLPPRRLAWSLLLVGLTDPVMIILLIAYAAMLPLGYRGGPVATFTAVIAVALTAVMTAVLSTIAGGILGPGARRGRDLGTIVTALALSLLALSGSLLPIVMGALEDRSAPWLTFLLRALPSGWGPNAVQAAAAGRPSQAAGWLTGLAVLPALAALSWPHLLQRRMSAPPHSDHASRTLARRRLLPPSPCGAVAAKELRGWVRDPLRLTVLLIAVVVGLGVGVIPRVAAHTGLLMPFAGPLTVVIAGACACNLYGNDGASLWLTITVPGSARADVRGRQLAWLLIVAPFTVVETIVMTGFSDEPTLWPWAIALLIALLGGATGLVPLASLIAVQRLDEAGNPTPGWSVKTQVALYATAATALPVAVVLVTAAITGQAWLPWAAIPVGVATAALFSHRGSILATRRLTDTQCDVLRHLAAD